MRKISIFIVCLLFAVQLFVPAQMIYQQENTLVKGTAYKFKTRPIDPTDPFRGKYITLNYELNSFQTDEDWNDYKGTVFVYLTTDAEGFASIKTVSKSLLDDEDDYVIAESSYNYSKTVHFNLPFNRFYMNERKAYDAEVSVQNAQKDSLKTCYGLVYVKDGTAVLDNVFIDNIPIQQFVDEFQNKN